MHAIRPFAYYTISAAHNNCVHDDLMQPSWFGDSGGFMDSMGAVRGAFAGADRADGDHLCALVKAACLATEAA